MLLMGKDKQSDQSTSTIAEQQSAWGEQPGEWRTQKPLGEGEADPVAFGCLCLYAPIPTSLGLF